MANKKTDKKTIKKTTKKENTQVPSKQPSDTKTITTYMKEVKTKIQSHSKICITILVIISFLLGVGYAKIEATRNNKQITHTIGQKISPLPTQNPNSIPKIDNGHLPPLGNRSAKVTIIEFSDFQCPFCKRFFDDTEEQLRSDYVNTNKVVVYYRQLPLSFHANAEKAAEAAECANDQNMFWNYHDLLFKNQDLWANQIAKEANSSFIEYATQLGLNTQIFATCLNTNKDNNKIKKDTQVAAQNSINATPTFMINGHILVGARPYPELRTIIDNELKKENAQ